MKRSSKTFFCVTLTTALMWILSFQSTRLNTQVCATEPSTAPATFFQRTDSFGAIVHPCCHDHANFSGFRDVVLKEADKIGRKYPGGVIVGWLYQDLITDSVKLPEYAAPWNVAADKYKFSLIPGIQMVDAAKSAGLLRAAWNDIYNDYGAMVWTNAMLLDHRTWDTLGDWSIILCKTFKARKIFIDNEACFWETKNDGFWTDANISVVSVNFKKYYDRMKLSNITPLVYHPHLHPSFVGLQYSKLWKIVPSGCEIFQPALFYYSDRTSSPGDFARKEWSKIYATAITYGLPSQALFAHPAMYFDPLQKECWTGAELSKLQKSAPVGSPQLWNYSITFVANNNFAKLMADIQ